MHTHAHKGRLGTLLESMRELVFGLEDSLVSTTGAVAGIAAGTADAKIVILSGVVLVVVEALSMTAGSYLSNKSHREMLEKKIRDEKEEIETKPEEETEELRLMYRARGFSEDEVAILVKRITADKKLWLEEMMAKELRIGAAELDEPKISAAVMGVAYVIGGAVPVLPYLFLSVGPAMVVSVAVAGASLFALGYWKATVTGLNRLRSGTEMLTIAAAAALAGYVIGKLLGGAFGLTV
jgi:predicted membrane protein (TIGR00267 family)